MQKTVEVDRLRLKRSKEYKKVLQSTFTERETDSKHYFYGDKMLINLDDT